MERKFSFVKSFEKNIIVHFSTQEHIFDHIFSNLNITDNSINHPVLITEPVCNLSFFLVDHFRYMLNLRNQIYFFIASVISAFVKKSPAFKGIASNLVFPAFLINIPGPKASLFNLLASQLLHINNM